MKDMRFRILTPLLVLLVSACQALVAPTATATFTATSTATPTATNTATVTATTAPSATASVTSTPSATPTITPTATSSHTPTITLTPSVTAMPAPRFVYDNWQVVELAPGLRDGLDSPMVVILNQNDRRDDYDVRTPRPATNSQTLYYAAPFIGGVRLPVLQTSAAAVSRITVAPPGNGVAWFVSEPTASAGLYLLDLEVGISGRVLALDSRQQRNLLGEPQWAPDGSQLVLAVTTAWASDIYSVARSSGAFINLTNSHSRDFWPSLSPDGRYLLFVSDRARCPGGWLPGAQDGCDFLRDEVHEGGNPWLLEIESGELRQLSERWLPEAPYWVNERLVALADGDLQRRISLLDIVSGEERRVHPQDNATGQGGLAEVWSPDGSRVVLQDTSATASVTTLLDGEGQRIAAFSRLTFPRYGMAAAWSPNGQRVALGGIGGNCPYGVRVLDDRFNVIASGSIPPGMCDPAYASNGQLAFTGVSTRVDGRIDVYVANSNGFGVRNLTTDLRGQIQLLGWVGG